MMYSGFLPRLRLAASPLKPSLPPASKRSSSSSSRQPRCAAALEPPDVGRLAEAARISLSPQEVEEFGPKIRQVVDWFGQLQAVDLESIEPPFKRAPRLYLSQGKTPQKHSITGREELKRHYQSNWSPKNFFKHLQGTTQIGILSVV